MTAKKGLSGTELLLAANSLVTEAEKNGELSSGIINLLIENPDTRDIGIEKFLTSSTEVASEVLSVLPFNFLFDLVCKRDDAIQILFQHTSEIAGLWEISEELFTKIKLVDWDGSDIMTLSDTRNKALKEWTDDQTVELDTVKRGESQEINEEVLAASEIWTYSNRNRLEYVDLNGQRCMTERVLEDFIFSENISLESKQKLVAKFEKAKNEFILLTLLVFLPEDDNRRTKIWDRLFSFTRSWWSRAPKKTLIVTHPDIGEAVKTQFELDRVLKYVSSCEFGLYYFFSTYMYDSTKPEFRAQVIKQAYAQEPIGLREDFNLLKEYDLSALKELSSDLVAKYYESELAKLLR